MLVWSNEGISSLAGYHYGPTGPGSPASQAALTASAPCKVTHTTKKSAGHCGAAKHKATAKAKHPAHHRATLRSIPSAEQLQTF